APDGLHDRDRHAQPAAGGAGLADYRVLLAGAPDRGRTDRRDLHQPETETDRGLRHRPVRLTRGALTDEKSSRNFKKELQLLKQGLLEMGDLAPSRIDRAMAGLIARDSLILGEVIQGD